MRRLIPKYAYIPFALWFIMLGVCFYLTRLFNTNWHHYDLSIPLDSKIPFVPAMIVVYIFSYVIWAVGTIMISHESADLCYEIMSAHVIAKLFATVIFLAVPTTMVRAEVTGSDIFSQLTRLIYKLDTPDNLFPSLHCLENWIICRGFLKCKHLKTGWKIGSFVAALAVFASVVTVRQHLFLDIPAGILVGELGLQLSARLKAGNVLKKINIKYGLHPKETEV